MFVGTDIFLSHYFVSPVFLATTKDDRKELVFYESITSVTFVGETIRTFVEVLAKSSFG